MPSPDKIKEKQAVSLPDYLGPEQKRCYGHIKNLVEEGDHYDEFTKKENFIRCIIDASHPFTTAEFLTQRAFRFGILPADREAVLSRFESELESRLEKGKLTQEEEEKIRESMKQIARINSAFLVFKTLQDNATLFGIVTALRNQVDVGYFTSDEAAEVLLHVSICPDQPLVIREKAEGVLGAYLFYGLLLDDDISNIRKGRDSTKLKLEPEAMTEMLMGIVTNPKYHPLIREKIVSLLYLDWEKFRPDGSDKTALFHAFQTGDMDSVPSFPALLPMLELSDNETVSSIAEAIVRTTGGYHILRRGVTEHAREEALHERGLMLYEPKPVDTEKFRAYEKYIQMLIFCLEKADPKGEGVESFIEKHLGKSDDVTRMMIVNAIPFLPLQGERTFRRLKNTLSDKDEDIHVKNAALESMAFLASQGRLSPEEVKWLFEYARARLKDSHELTPSLLVAFEDIMGTPFREGVLDTVYELVMASEISSVTEARVISILENATSEDGGIADILFKIAATTSNDDVYMMSLRTMAAIGARLDEDKFVRLRYAVGDRPIFYKREDRKYKIIALRYFNEIRPDGIKELTMASLWGGGENIMGPLARELERRLKTEITVEHISVLNRDLLKKILETEWEGESKKIPLMARTICAMLSGELHEVEMSYGDMSGSCLKGEADSKLAGIIGYFIQKFPEVIEGRCEAILDAVQTYEWALLFAAPELIHDREFAMECVKGNGKALRYLGNFNRDREVVSAAVGQNGMAIQYADTSLKNDPEVARLAVQKIYNAYALLPPEARKDPSVREIVKKKVREQAASPWPESALSDKAISSEGDFVLAAVEVNARLLELADRSLLNNSDFLSTAINTNFNTIIMVDKKYSAKVWQYLIEQLHAGGRSFPPEMEENYNKFSDILLKRYRINVHHYRQLLDVHEIFEVVRTRTAAP